MPAETLGQGTGGTRLMQITMAVAILEATVVVGTDLL